MKDDAEVYIESVLLRGFCHSDDRIRNNHKVCRRRRMNRHEPRSRSLTTINR